MRTFYLGLCSIAFCQSGFLGLCSPSAHAQDPISTEAQATPDAQSAGGGGRVCGANVVDGQSKRPTYCAQIRRTAFGVPHIKADDEKGLGFGIGYAYASDNFCLLADAIVTVNGERSKYFGPDGDYSLHGLKDQQNNLSSDFYFKYLNAPAQVRTSWEHQPQDVAALVRGYAAGFNRYLRQVGRGGLPDACKNRPWVRELDEQDIIRLMRRYAVEGSGAFFIDALYSAQAPGSGPNTGFPSRGGSPAPAHGINSARPDNLYSNQDLPGVGSNGVALGSTATESGAGLLLANPHFPWTTSLRFYQMHLTIPGKVNVMGSALGGYPGVNIGFNEALAWTHTVNTSVHYVIYQLTLDPSNPTRYLVDGKSKAMTRQELSVEALGADGKLSTVRRNYYLTDFGPVLEFEPLGIQWTRQNAFTLSDANLDNDRLYQQWWALDKASSLDEFKRSVQNILGLPWVHALATDKAGRVYYSDITPVPNVDESCLARDYEPLFPVLGFVLSGAKSTCKPRTDSSAPQRGILPARSLPSLQRNDYVQNSNDSAWLTNPAQKITQYSSLVSVDSVPQGARTRLGLSQIAARLAGTDGLPGKKFSAKSLQSLVLSNRSLYASVLLKDLLAACADNTPVIRQDQSTADISKGCKVLAGWDGKAELSSVGWPLFQSWRQALNETGLDYWAVPFDPADPIQTPRGLRISDPAVLKAARLALDSALQQLTLLGIRYDATWGSIQVSQRGADIPIHGGTGQDIYNAIESAAIGTTGKLDAFDGSSTIWTISFEGGAPQAQGFLTYSLSSNPASPYYADQTRRFSKKEWISYPFTERAIEAETGSTSALVTGD